ncbi:MAG: hypothetical protein K2Q23_08435 [Bryobacteraceae bacterium]|nr:hypothetical protein [Bryobacteraceae bacterium]
MIAADEGARRHGEALASGEQRTGLGRHAIRQVNQTVSFERDLSEGRLDLPPQGPVGIVGGNGGEQITERALQRRNAASERGTGAGLLIGGEIRDQQAQRSLESLDLIDQTNAAEMLRGERRDVRAIGEDAPNANQSIRHEQQNDEQKSAQQKAPDALITSGES